MNTKNEVAAKALDEARDIFKRLYISADLNGPESDNFMRGMRKLKNAADSLTQSPRIEDRAGVDVDGLKALAKREKSASGVFLRRATEGTDSLYRLAVEHGASEVGAAQLAHDINGEVNEMQSLVYTLAGALQATPSAAVGEVVPVAEIGMGEKPDGLGSRMSFTRLLDGAKALPAGKYLLYTTPTKPDHMVDAEMAKDAARWRTARNNQGTGLRLITWDPKAHEELQVMFPSQKLCDEYADAMLNATQGGKGEGE